MRKSTKNKFKPINKYMRNIFLELCLKSEKTMTKALDLMESVSWDDDDIQPEWDACVNDLKSLIKEINQKIEERK
jgi:hypothetical protein